MRRHSLTGPLLLLLLGGVFLWNNLHPEAPILDMIGQYWPFLLIAWGLLRLIEVLVWRRKGTVTAGLTGGEIALVVLICIAGAGTFELQRHGVRVISPGLDVFTEQFDYPVSASAPAGTAKRIVFENPRGNLRITGGDGQQIVVTGRKQIRAYSRGEADRANGTAQVEIVPQGDRILVRTNQARAGTRQRMSDDLEVTAPRGMTVEVHGETGDYEVIDVAGDVEVNGNRSDVRLTRIGGNARLEVTRSDMIRAVDVKGNVDIRGRGSDLALENVSGQVTINGAYMGSLEFKNLAKPLQFEGTRDTELRVQAVPGRISMDLGDFTANDVTGPMRFVTRSRDVKIENFTNSLDLDTERGDIELQPSGLPLPKIEARSGSGTIQLVLPEKAVFQLQATAERGDAVNDFGPSIQTQTNGRTATMKRSGDGPIIHLTADRGTVSVRKAGTPSSVRPPSVPQPPPGPPAPPEIPGGSDGRKGPHSLSDTEIKL